MPCTFPWRRRDELHGRSDTADRKQILGDQQRGPQLLVL
jgi:hypothetical protein